MKTLCCGTDLSVISPENEKCTFLFKREPAASERKSRCGKIYARIHRFIGTDMLRVF